jgi:drug/metabolite transporter (DMT)-like permease
METKEQVQQSRSGIYFALFAALLFGASTPFSKILLGKNDPIVLAALLYLGSGVGLTLWWKLRRSRTNRDTQEAGLKPADLPWLAGAILSGGVGWRRLAMWSIRVGAPQRSASIASGEIWVMPLAHCFRESLQTSLVCLGPFGRLAL